LGHRADARELLKLVDIFVLPSRNEGLPISLLEAMAAKCAVVATHVGEVQSVIECESQGIIVPPDDAESLARGIASYLESDQMLDSCKKKGFERVESSFSALEMTRQYTEIYAKVIGIS
jgi:glycosyltransferase involved in cell wall biosynthesis